MNHTDSGALIAWLDGELPVEVRGELDAHLAECDSCRTELSGVQDLAQQFDDAIGLLNPRIPLLSARVAIEQQADRSRFRRSRRFMAASLAKAAAITLLVAGAAAAAIPGSPVRKWVSDVVARIAGSRVETPVAVAAPTVAEPLPQEPAGPAVTVPTGGTIRVSIHALPASASLTVKVVDRDGVFLRALGANDPVRFVPRSDASIEVFDVRTGLVIELPKNLTSASIDVDGRPYYTKDAAGERFVGPGAKPGNDGVTFRSDSR
jgi:predicted anti-sigma-YlaC factor YlaD